MLVLGIALAFLTDTNAGTVAALAGGAFTAISTLGAAFFGIRVAAESANQAQQTAVNAQQQAGDAKQQAAAAEQEAARALDRASTAERALADFQRAYSDVSRTPAGPTRTVEKDRLLGIARERIGSAASSPSLEDVHGWLESDEEEVRVKSLAAMYEYEDLRDFELVLRNIVFSRSGFEQFHYLRLMKEMVHTLDETQREQLEDALERARWTENITGDPLRVDLTESILNALRAAH